MPSGISLSWAIPKDMRVRSSGSAAVLTGALGPVIVSLIVTRTFGRGWTSSRVIIAGGDTGEPGETLWHRAVRSAGKPSGGSDTKKAYASCLTRSANVELPGHIVVFLPASTQGDVWALDFQFDST